MKKLIPSETVKPAIREIKIKLEVMTERHLLRGFKPADTAKDVKVKASEMLDTLVEGDLSCGTLFLVPARHLKDTDTLGTYCYGQLDSSQALTLHMRLYPCLDKHKNIDIFKAYEKYVNNVKLCEEVLIEHGGNTGTKRPARQLPAQATQVQDRLCCSGPLSIKDGICEIPLERLLIGCEVDASTTATVVLLAPNDTIFRKLCALPLRRQEYLIVRVTWDLTSYYFVRLLRDSNNSLPIVAVTDLDPDHLDLFTFLDTPFDILPKCYGWDHVENPLYYPTEETVLSKVEAVKIKWLGLRPPQCTNSRHTSDDDLASSGDKMFFKVIRLVEVHPIVQGKPGWLSALTWLYRHGKRVVLHPCTSNSEHPMCPTSLLQDVGFITDKVSQKDWV